MNLTLKRLLLVKCFVAALCSPFPARSQEVSFSREDRERIIRLEERLGSLPKEMDARFHAVQKEMDVRFDGFQKEVDVRFDGFRKEMNARFDAQDTRFDAQNDKLDKLYTLMYFILGGVFGLIGLIFWDRRSYIRPVKGDIRDLQSVLREYARKQPDLADILRSKGLL